MSERVFRAPGRVEIGGNHTDHQRGRVLAAAIDLETTCIASENGSRVVNIVSEGFGAITADLSDLSVREDEKDTPAAAIRGVAAWFSNNGHAIGGFDGRVSSDVPLGSGLSSSAAFEVVIGNAFRGLFGAGVSDLEIALAGQFAENNYFGKPSGLMDQSASSIGGLNKIDFRDPRYPVITPVRAALEGYALCVVDTGGNHADLTPDYAAIPAEMKAVAAFFGKEFLSELDAGDFYGALGELRHLGDRPLLRAIHFFEDNARVSLQAEALENGRVDEFLRLVKESGLSSLKNLQNVFSSANPSEQGLTLALALCERVLGGEGAYRVHGGGFAGTILAFVPEDMTDRFRRRMSEVFGESCCHFLKINPLGGREVEM
ncbi:MAG: hypothetical protein FWH25_04030 [Syntrophorhabdaceae bacterium]|nr:hypothetical protein [Syntrophorhabdaceae bacterium]